ncbi:hypothetical protein [Desulfobulbus sp.]|uniref:hypothetical protein n=1 Tax=Desulfobulbus sp. TaxID=895 RepID=UPI00286F6384|nr:hypothetical protein [Desulfobulbus sp.]
MRSGWMMVLFLVAVGCAAGGCTRGPGAFFAGQEEIDSVDQWNVLANHVADRVSKELIQQQHLNSTIYVRHACGAPGKCGGEGTFAFDEGFNDLLTTQLVHFGIPTAASPERASLTLEYKVQTVYHSSGFGTWNWPKPGMLIALAAGIVVLEDAPWELITAATAAEVYRNNGGSGGHYEVIITTSIIDKKRYLMRSSDIYYLNNSNLWHFRPSTPAKEIQLTGNSASPSSRPARKAPL